MRLKHILLIFSIIVFVCTTFPIDTIKAENYPKMKVRIASIYPPGLNENLALQRFIDAVSEKSNGKITFRYNQGTSLGKQNEINELTTTGGLDMVCHGMAPSEAHLGLYLPFTFLTYEHLHKLMKSDVAAKWDKDVQEKTGLKVFGAWGRGFRQVICSKPLYSIDDLKGMKIRTPKIPALVAAVKSWESVPVIISIAEVYTSLATGAVDGMENTNGGFLKYKFYEVAKNVLLTKHVLSPVFWLANSKWWNGLPSSVQILMESERDKAIEWAIAQNKSAEGKWVKELKSKGVAVRAPKNPNSFREAFATFQNEQAIKFWGKEDWEKIKAME